MNTLPDSLTFDYRNYKGDEECPRCHRVTWLGECSDGTKMCQACYFGGMSIDEINKTI